MTKVSIQIEHRRATAAEFAAVNRVLLAGEPAYETDTHKQKIGDGVTHYLDLPYFTDSIGSGVTQVDLQQHVDSPNPHPVYDDGPSFLLLYENAKV